MAVPVTMIKLFFPAFPRSQALDTSLVFPWKFLGFSRYHLSRGCFLSSTANPQLLIIVIVIQYNTNVIVIGEMDGDCILFSFVLLSNTGGNSQLQTGMLQQAGFRIEFAIGPLASWGNMEVGLQNSHKRIFAELVNLVVGVEGGRALVLPPVSACFRFKRGGGGTFYINRVF